MRFHIEYAWGIDNKKYTALAEKLAATKIKTEIERTGELSVVDLYADLLSLNDLQAIQAATGHPLYVNYELHVILICNGPIDEIVGLRQSQH